MNEILYKSLPTNKAPNNHKFRLNKWYKEDNISICNRGFHASKNIIDAMNYVAAGYVAKVEVRGESVIEDDKQCWSEMRVVKWKKWTKKDSVSLAIFAAELVINNYEKEYLNDKRPREAIEAAKLILKSDTKKNRSAARSAAESAAESAARFARSAAWSAAWSAARSAESAWFARSAAESAARSAARSAESAAESAESAAKKKILNECHKFVIKQAGLN